jgi:DNA-binding IscR family transcriptional regulator
MSDVLRALEGPIAPMICATEEPHEAHLAGCDRTARCSVNLLWVRIRDAISGTLEGMTLADLVPLRTAPGLALADPQPSPTSREPEPVPA